MEKNFFFNAVNDSHVTLKQGQGNQSWYELVDLKEGYNHAKFEKPHFNNAHKKNPTVVFFFFFWSNQETCPFSPLNMCESQK